MSIRILRGNQNFYNETKLKLNNILYICENTSNMYVGETLLFNPNDFKIAKYYKGDLIFITHDDQGYKIDMSKFNNEELLMKLKETITKLLTNDFVIKETTNEQNNKDLEQNSKSLLNDSKKIIKQKKLSKNKVKSDKIL